MRAGSPASPPHPPRIFTPEYYAHIRELERRSWWNAGMRDIALNLLVRAGLPDRGVMVDAGCGSGQTMSWFVESCPKWFVAGLDIALEPLVFARAAGQSVAQASVLALPVADGAVDLVISLDVLQHLPLQGGDSDALSEFARILRPGGTLLIRTNAQAFPRAEDDPDAAFRKYEPGALRAVLVANGFEILRMGRVNALLGLAEIPRELRARNQESRGYHGILSSPLQRGRFTMQLKRSWLNLEGRALASGWQLPFGRTIFALCRKRR
jgi:SAM-dependent methyltransferase